jgi:hypothetical protein
VKTFLSVIAIILMVLSTLVGLFSLFALFADSNSMMASNAIILGAAVGTFLFAGIVWLLCEILSQLGEHAKKSVAEAQRSPAVLNAPSAG